MKHVGRFCGCARGQTIAVVVGLVLCSGGSFRAQDTGENASGQQVLELVSQFSRPLGVNAAELRSQFLGKSFDEIVTLESQWSRSHVRVFDATTVEEHRGDLLTTMDGDDDLLGMRKWADPGVTEFWVPGIVNVIANDGFTQVVRFHSAFAAPESTLGHNHTTGFRFVAGQSRSYDSTSNVMFLNGLPFPGAQNPIFPLDPGGDPFTQLVTFGGKVRDQIDNFYSAFQAGTVSTRAVRTFNEAFVLAGLFDLTNSQHNLVDTDGDGVVDGIAGVDRSANAHNNMADVQDRLGFPVRLASFSLVQDSFSPINPGSYVTLKVDSDVGFRGGEVALAYDSGALALESVALAEGFPSSTQIFVNETPNNGCPLGDDVHAGVAVAWINLLGANQSVLTSAGSHDVLRYCFSPLTGVADTGCQSLRFVDCLGDSRAPVLNALGGELGASLLAETNGWRTFDIDVHPPTIFCPDDVSMRCAGTACAIEYDVPVATDSCSGTVEVVCDPAPGTVLPTGAHRVTCTATDSVGNSTSCVFTINIEANNFQRGNVNADGRRDVADVVTVLLHLFLGLPIPCDDAADVNDDGSKNLTDAISLLQYRFQGGSPPPTPFVDCGSDPTADSLDCQSFSPCEPIDGA